MGWHKHAACRSLAEADLADPAATFGRYELPCKKLPGHQLVEHHQAAAAAAMAAAAAATSAATLHQAATGETIGSRNSIFITQRATAGSTAAGGTGGEHDAAVAQGVAGSEAAAAGGDGSSSSRSKSKSGHWIGIVATGEERSSIAAAATGRR